jgi:hypothetical protein
VQNHAIEIPLYQRNIRSNAAEKNCDEVIVRQKRFSHAALVLEAGRSRSIGLGLPNRQRLAITLHFDMQSHCLPFDVLQKEESRQSP